MRTRNLLLLFAVSMLAAFQAAEAQQQAKVPKIGWLGARSASGPSSGPVIIRRELSALGYIEGKNVTFNTLRDKFERLPSLTNELVRLNVDIILTDSTPNARAAKNATRTIPRVLGRS